MNSDVNSGDLVFLIVTNRPGTSDAIKGDIAFVSEINCVRSVCFYSFFVSTSRMQAVQTSNAIHLLFLFVQWSIKGNGHFQKDYIIRGQEKCCATRIQSIFG